jgi:hypothetical protein
MADTVPITAGSGTTISTDERTINSTAQHVQRIYDMGGTAIVAGQTTVTNSSTSIIGATETRKRVVLINRQTVPVWIGPSAATTSMFRVDPGASVTLYTTAAVYGITAAAYSATSDDKVHYIEETSA